MEDEVKQAYLKYFESYVQRKLEDTLSAFSQDFNMIGTGVDEFSVTYQYSAELFRREFSQAPEPLTYQFKVLKVYPITNDAAYILGLVDMRFLLPTGEFEYTNNRTTAILRKENGEWKILHGHWSQPAELQQEGESVPLSAVLKQNRELKNQLLIKQQELEKQNQQLKEMNQSLSKLFSIVSHDLKSPFNAFLGITDLMLMNFEDDFENKEYFQLRLQLLNDLAHNLYDLTENLLNWAKLNSNAIEPKFREFPIDSFIQKQVNILRPIWQKKRIKLTEEVPNELMVNSDPDMLAVIVRNLLTNAIKFSYPEGEIKIEVTNNSINTAIKITDNGIGMSAEQMQSLFKDYQSTRGTDNEKGTGIGLVTCKELTNKLRGELKFSSELNKGTTVVVELPK
ncbi:MAG: ATP-binding protein [Bacteroidota bacterium]